MVIVPAVIFNAQFMTKGPVPKDAVVAPETMSVPFCIDPAVKVAVVPLAVNANPPRFSVPLVTIRLLTLAFPERKQLLDPVTMITLSPEAGIPAGDQLAAVVHAVDAAPFQV